MKTFSCIWSLGFEPDGDFIGRAQRQRLSCEMRNLRRKRKTVLLSVFSYNNGINEIISMSAECCHINGVKGNDVSSACQQQRSKGLTETTSENACVASFSILKQHVFYKLYYIQCWHRNLSEKLNITVIYFYCIALLLGK